MAGEKCLTFAMWQPKGSVTHTAPLGMLHAAQYRPSPFAKHSPAFQSGFMAESWSILEDTWERKQLKSRGGHLTKWQKGALGSSRVADQVKALATKPDALSLAPGTYAVEREN